MDSILDNGISRRSFVKAATTTAAASLIAGLGISAIDAKPVFAGEADKPFIYAIAGDPGSNVNPVTTSDRFGLMSLKLLFNQLFVYRADGIQWFLADSVEESEDHLEFTFKLHEGVTWTDGEPFTAEDVVFTYQTIANEPTADAYSSLNYGDQGMVEVEAIDDLTVKFTFPFLDAGALEKLQGPDGVWIFPKHVYEGVSDWENNDVNANPIGTGPYTMADYQAGSYVQFAKNPNYAFGDVNADIVFQIVTNETSGMQAIQTGQVNAWIGTAAQVEQMDIEGNGLTVWPYTENRVAYINFNVNNVPDENVRKAFFYALDRPTIGLAAVLDPAYFEPEYTFLPFTSEYYNPDAVEKYERDVAKAQKLLEEAGQPNPTFVLGYNGSDSLQTNASLLIQEQAAEAGITIELRGTDSSALSQAQRDKDDTTYDLYFGGYIMGIDPDSYSGLFTSGSVANYAKFDNPATDELFAQGRIETDVEKRHEIYDALQAEIQEHATFYPLYSNMRLLVTTGNVTGIEDAKLIPIFTFEEFNKLDVQ